MPEILMQDTKSEEDLINSNCPICFRYFDGKCKYVGILKTSCCKNQVCVLCVIDINKSSEVYLGLLQTGLKKSCPFCLSVNIEVLLKNKNSRVNS